MMLEWRYIKIKYYYYYSIRRVPVEEEIIKVYDVFEI